MLTLPHLIRSEWIKLRTLRATWVNVALFGLGDLGLTAMTAQLEAANVNIEPDLNGSIVHWTTDWSVRLAIPGVVALGMIFMVVLGASVVTSEYSSGSIRSTLSAAPRRGLVVVAKAIVVAAFCFVVTVAVEVAAVGVAQTCVVAQGFTAPISVNGVKSAAGATLFVVVAALVGMGLGLLLRSNAAAVAVGLGLYLVLPGLASVSQEPLALHLMELLPTSAGNIVSEEGFVVWLGEGITPWVTTYGAAAAVLVAWGVVLPAAGWGVFRRRDG
ncbi:MAG: ABC transporter permease subunit [Bifidobacteriaceae bacterium]|jgi:ABC-2 type transport system permease protein|nr:ABC transporter permease subunit [Bifidobacteriaceae bacterium]